MGEDRELADAVADAKLNQGGEDQGLNPMEAKLEEARLAAKQKGLYVE